MKRHILKQLLFSIVALFLFDGCDKNDPEPLPCLLTSQATTGSGSTYTYNLVLDNRTAISGINTAQTPTSGFNTFNATYTYNSAGDLSEIIYSSGTREVYTYTNGKITRKEMFNNSTLVDRTDYEYTNEQLIKVQEYSLTLGTTSLAKDDYQIFEYAAPTDTNPMRGSYFYSPSDTRPASTSEFTFGDQKSAFAAAPAGLIKYFKVGGQSTDKAILKTVLSNSTTTQTITYEYEFNATGYPTKRTDTYSSSLQPRITTYKYDCN